jgi:hypothetical protein
MTDRTTTIFGPCGRTFEPCGRGLALCGRVIALCGLATACDPTPDGKEDAAGTEGATDWSMYQDSGDTGAASSGSTAGSPGTPETPGSTDESDPWGRNLDCPQPDACISLAEAMDRGFAAVTLSSTLDVDNFGPYPICSGRWHTFFSDGSQDAIAGHSDVVWPGEPKDAFEIVPEEIWRHEYARSLGGPAWWCIERTQVTQAGASYRFTGARAPHPLLAWVHTESDTNTNGTEDHVDYADPSTGAPWTNHNIWDHLAAQPTYVVGRTKNYLEMQPGTSSPLTIEVVNLGRDTSSIHVQETLPAGTRSYDFSVRPSSSETNSDGSTTHDWYFKMNGSVDNPDLSTPTDYDMVQIDFQVVWERADCGYREEGEAPSVTWTDNTGATYTSYGTELVIVCCDGT